MKILSFKLDKNSKTQVGVSFDGENIFSLTEYNAKYISIDDVVKFIGNEDFEEVKKTKPYKLSEIVLAAPMPKNCSDVICLGINYMEHAAESAKFKNEEFSGERPNAVYFSKRVNEALATMENIPAHGDITSQLDYEAELALIISKDAKNVKAENAKDYVLGYTILNDVSARDIQNKHKQWYRGKSLDGFCPVGPWIVTADEFEFPPKLQIKSFVNGELRQNSNTELQIFNIPFIIEELSKGITLKAGTVISTGTPAGVGMGFVPPKFLNIGDEVVCEIEGIGELRNCIEE